MKNVFVVLGLLTAIQGFGQIGTAVQTETDTLPKNHYMAEITIVGRGSKSDYQQMPEIVGTNIYAGKKMPSLYWIMFRAM